MLNIIKKILVHRGLNSLGDLLEELEMTTKPSKKPPAWTVKTKGNDMGQLNKKHIDRVNKNFEYVLETIKTMTDRIEGIMDQINGLIEANNDTVVEIQRIKLHTGMIKAKPFKEARVRKEGTPDIPDEMLSDEHFDNANEKIEAPVKSNTGRSIRLTN